jgi:hypothetical protein
MVEQNDAEIIYFLLGKEKKGLTQLIVKPAACTPPILIISLVQEKSTKDA